MCKAAGVSAVVKRMHFDSLYTHGFVRIAAGAPRVAVAGVVANLQRTIELAQRAAKLHSVLVVFPSSGYQPTRRGISLFSMRCSMQLSQPWHNCSK